MTHWSRVTHKCVSKLTIIGSNDGLSPGRHQAIIWTNAGISLIGHSGTNLSEIFIKIQITHSCKCIYLKMPSAKWPFCLSLSVLNVTLVSFGAAGCWQPSGQVWLLFQQLFLHAIMYRSEFGRNRPDIDSIGSILAQIGYATALTHWGRVTQICVSKLFIIGSDNGLSPGRRQAIIWTNAGILLIGTLGTNFS